MATAKQTTPLDLQQYMDFLSRHIEEHRIRSRSVDIVKAALGLKDGVPLRNFFEAQVSSFLQEINANIETYQPDYVSRIILELANRLREHVKENTNFILYEYLPILEKRYPLILWDIQTSETVLAGIKGRSDNGKFQVVITLPSALTGNYWDVEWAVSRLENLKMGGAELWPLLESGLQMMMRQADFEIERIRKDREMLGQFLGELK